MLLFRIAVHVYTPELASNLALPHPHNIGVAQQALIQVQTANSIMQLNPQLPR